MDIDGEGGEAVSLVDKITAEMDARRVGRYLALIDEAKVIRATVVKVSKVKAENGAPGKAKITFQAPNEDDPEDIETEWLSDPVAHHIGAVAKEHIGRQVLLFKHNTEPTKEVPQGYRRVIWIEAL